MDSLLGRSWVALGSSWGQVGVNLGSTLVDLESIRGQSWVHCRSIWNPVWGRSGVDPGLVQGRFLVDVGSVWGQPKRTRGAVTLQRCGVCGDQRFRELSGDGVFSATTDLYRATDITRLEDAAASSDDLTATPRQVSGQELEAFDTLRQSASPADAEGGAADPDELDFAHMVAVRPCMYDFGYFQLWGCSVDGQL